MTKNKDTDCNKNVKDSLVPDGKEIEFINKTKSCSTGHCIGLTTDGSPYTWAIASWGTRFGQLCRIESTDDMGKVTSLPLSSKCKLVRAGGTKESGHTAFVVITSDKKERLYMGGCDRWQQLGLGMQSGGASGYTWQGGRIWQETPQHCVAMDGIDDGIKDIELGTDHTVVLSNNCKDVYTFGRGEHGQLGLNTKRFVSPATLADKLSEKDPIIHGVLAIGNCTATIDINGEILKTVGQCRGLLDALRSFSLKKISST